MGKILGLVLFLLLILTGCSKNVKPNKDIRGDRNTTTITTTSGAIIDDTLFDWQQNDEILQEGRAAKIVVVKSKRVLVLFDENGEVLSRHRISLGKNPVGTKLKEGDYKTPEGIYSIVDIRTDPKYYKEILISYPNEEDRRRSRELGFNPGGGITFHAQVPWNWDGHGDDYTLEHDWTIGCMAMTNRGMDDVWSRVDKNTVVEIRE